MLGSAKVRFGVRATTKLLSPAPDARLSPKQDRPLFRWRERYGLMMEGVAARLVNLSALFMGRQSEESLYSLPRLLAVHNRRPAIMDNCFIAPSAILTGDVRVGRKNYIGYNAIIRAERGETIFLGESCNIQEKAVVTGNTSIGKWCSIEPMCVVESSDIASCSLVGASAVVMRGCTIESGSILCSASILQAGAIVPSGEIWSGNPAVCIGRVTEKQKEDIIKAAKHMVLLAIEHHDSWALTWEEIESQRIAREDLCDTLRDHHETRSKAMYIKEPPRPNRKPMSRFTPKEINDNCENKPLSLPASPPRWM